VELRALETEGAEDDRELGSKQLRRKAIYGLRIPLASGVPLLLAARGLLCTGLPDFLLRHQERRERKWGIKELLI
jgi:hypothetical protein